MNTKTLFVTFTALLVSLVNIDCYAQQRNVTFDFEASVGVEADSAVGIAEIDDTTGEADRAAVITADLKLAVPIGKPMTLRFGYDYAGSRYTTFSEFDLGLHHAFAEVAFSNRHIDAALTADRYEGILDGEHYLTFNQVSPSVARMFGNRVYARAAYIVSDKDFDQLPTRNANGKASRLDTYLLLDGMQHYLSFGLQHGSEDAIDDELDYDSLQASLAYGYQFVFPLMQLNMQAQARYEQRDYVYVTEAIEAQRIDKRLRTALTATIPFGDHVHLTGSVEHTDNDSNLESAVIDKMVYAVGLKLNF